MYDCYVNIQASIVSLCMQGFNHVCIRSRESRHEKHNAQVERAYLNG